VTIAELFEKGGVAMWPLALLSVLALGTILERIWFWLGLLSREKETIDKVLDASNTGNWDRAVQVAREARHRPIGRFLYAPLRRKNPDPETFKLALEASAEEELHAMRRGEKILQAAIALSPLLGLLGTVLGLIRSLNGIKLTDLSGGSGTGVTLGISESLISTATGMIVAITSVAFYWVFQGLLIKQVNLFRRSGNELELLYRERYHRTGRSNPPARETRGELDPVKPHEETELL
jgi:biopolymer transport protein ExbB